jgi:lambda family phage portal protein
MATRGRKPSLETQIARTVAQVVRGASDQPAAEPPARQYRARYDAAGQGRRLAGWNPPSSGPNGALTGLATIRNRARDSSRNDWSGASGVQKWTSNLIGIGITPRFKRVKSKTRKQELIDIYSDFVAQADADGVLNFYGLQTLAVRSWLDGGEVFARRRNRPFDDGLAVPMQVQLLESDMVPMFNSTAWQGLPTNNVIKDGIEFDRRGKRIAYWVYKEHPGDTAMGMMPERDKLVRVAASEMCHIFEPLRPGQRRGVSMLAPILARLRNIENYDDATLTRQQLANLVVAFITKQMPQITGDEDINGLTGQLIDEEDPSTGAPLVGMQPGLIQELDEGQDVTWSNPPEAGTNYSDYMRTQHMGTAAATGLPYEIFSGDIRNVSDRTLRVLVNEFRRLAEQRQWQIVIPQLCQRVIEWFAEASILAGKATADEYDEIRRVEWSPHGWAHIHPTQDPDGKRIELEMGVRSRSSIIAERGDDPDLVDEERRSDMERAEALGLTPVVAPAGQSTQDPANADPDPTDQQEEQQAQAREILRLRAEAISSNNALTQRIVDLLEPNSDLFE